MKGNAYPLVLAAAGVLIVGVAGVMIWRSNQKHDADERSGASVIRPAPPPQKKTLRAEVPVRVIAQDTPLPPAPIASPKRGKPPAQNPAARAALSLVGVDSSAELVWMEAINDPNLPAHERADLIEDLNEDGLSNRKQPAVVDLPLINARLAIIDRLMPDAMDKTNADALAEARKDLVNMQVRLSR